MQARAHLGNVFGKYRLLAELGHGGMATVYLAATGGPGGFNKLSVLKLLRDLHEPTAVEMFLEEARLAAQLNHPNVVQTHEVGKVSDQYFIAMEFIDGPALNRLRRRVPIPLPIALHLILAVLDGLRYAHALRGYDGAPLMLVHRDLSPQNVLVTYEGDCKIVDFGIAKALDSPQVTREGIFKGKLTYMPPEQVRGLPVDQRADVFAVGALLFEVISGKRLWQGENELVVVQRLSAGDVPRLNEVRQDVSLELVELCNWALHPDLEARCPSAASLQSALESHVRASGLTATRRDLADLVARTFAADRERLQRIIAAQLREASTSPTREYLALSLPRASYGSSTGSLDSGSAEESVDVSLSDHGGTVTPAVPSLAAAGAAAPPLSRRRLLPAALAVLVLLLALAGVALAPLWAAAPGAPARPAPAPGGPAAEVASGAAAPGLPGAQGGPAAEVAGGAAAPGEPVAGEAGGVVAPAAHDSAEGVSPPDRGPAGAAVGGPPGPPTPGAPAPPATAGAAPSAASAAGAAKAVAKKPAPRPQAPSKDDTSPDELGF